MRIVEELVSCGEELSEEELLAEVNVRAYVRNGSEQVAAHTRSAGRVGFRKLKNPKYKRTGLERYKTDELAAAVDDRDHALRDRVRPSSRDIPELRKINAARKAGAIDEDNYDSLTDEFYNQAERAQIKREMQLRKRRIGDQGKYKGYRVQDKAVRGVKRQAKQAARQTVDSLVKQAQQAARDAANPRNWR